MKNNAARKRFEELLFEETRLYYSSYASEKIVIYGAGLCGRKYLSLFKQIGLKDNVIAVADDDEKKWGKKIQGIYCDNIENIQNTHKDFLVIVCSKYEEIIRKKLSEMDIRVIEQSKWAFFLRTQWMHAIYENQSSNEVCNVWHFFDEYIDAEEVENKKQELFEYLIDEQSRIWVEKRIDFLLTGDIEFVKDNQCTNAPEYYDPQFMNNIAGENEVFVDCGAYDGDSILDYVYATNRQYKKIYGIEADPENYKLLTSNINDSKLDNVITINAAVGSKNGVLSFYSDGTIGAKVTEEGNVEIDVVSLDDLITEEVTFIKMDIEGAELEGLIGAKRIIKEYKPKMAICLYHKANDIFNIPKYIHQLVPEYEFKIVSHSNTIYNMVLYCSTK